MERDEADESKEGLLATKLEDVDMSSTNSPANVDVPAEAPGIIELSEKDAENASPPYLLVLI
jgi:hypothetical protein